jgi:proteasome lid subunit RPN8/RPN11
MKKRVFMNIVLLAIIGTSAVFAQTINGLWRTAIGNVISIYDDKAVMTETNARDWKEAEKKGNIGIGAQSHRNIKSTGNLTWTGQYLSVNSSTYAVSWAGNVTFRMNTDGRTMQVQYQGGTGGGTWTRISNNEIDGLWRTAIGNVISIYDGKAIMTETNARDWKEAEKRGNISIGVQSHRNIKSTGNLTWTGQYLSLNSSTYAVSWAGNVTFTMNPDGRTMQVQYQGGTGGGTWTRIQ